jgi:hypothetical protein
MIAHFTGAYVHHPLGSAASSAAATVTVAAAHLARWIIAAI